jgi:branched-chain amino acid transport system ATP-binding protein
MSLLEVKHLKVKYKRVEAVKGVSISVETGSIVALLGNNGAGKSTILRAISGLEKPDDGEIWFDEKRIDGIAPQNVAKAGMAHCLEGRRLFPQMTVLENLEMGAYLPTDKTSIKRTLCEVFEHFPVLKKRQRQLAGTLSGGEQQMLAIGRALMTRPKMLLLDEPSMGLAPKVVKEIGVILRVINERKVSLLLAEQNSKLGLGLASRAYVLEVGEVVVMGEAEDLLKNDLVRQAYLGG